MLIILALLLAAASPAAPQLPYNCAAAETFTGTVCAPRSPGKHPAVILLGGSEGGDLMSYAAPQFAAQGYLAASVAYFGIPGLPQSLENIPVETVGKAIAAIASRQDVDPNRIAIMGLSKGGELALLSASLYPQIHAVVAAVSSPFAWQGIAQGFGPPAASWIYGGKTLPYVAYGSEIGRSIGIAFSTHQPLDLRPGYQASMKDHADQIPGAMFHLENIRGPILFLAAGDDQVWNSAALSQLGMTYLKAHHHPYADAYQEYPAAGHVFLFAGKDRPMTSAPLGPLTLLLGGTPQANVAAAGKAWPSIFKFLASALK